MRTEQVALIPRDIKHAMGTYSTSGSSEGPSPDTQAEIKTSLKSMFGHVRFSALFNVSFQMYCASHLMKLLKPTYTDHLRGCLCIFPGVFKLDEGT